MPSDSTQPTQSAKPIIFISYAHADEPKTPRGEEIQWLSFVMKFLRPAVKYGEFRIWVDRQMPGGTEWDEEIKRHLRACNIFVLLVSANSMGSDYIFDKELKIALERQTAGVLQVYPLLIEPTPRAGLDSVRRFNLRPPDAKPLQSYSLAERNQLMSDAADEIADIAKAIAEQKSAAAAQDEPSKPVLIPSEIPARQGIVAPNARIEGIAPEAPAPATPIPVDVSRLPETGYERLVGREAVLARLDEAWSDDKTNILSLVAEGGAGKSALVNEWLVRLRADLYCGADCVLGWSFYSQGSKERATAADEFLNWALDKLGVKVESTSASAKGEAIAEALTKRRVLLVLDGVEPLLHGPGPQAGQLKDQGLRALLRRLAAAPPAADHSLIVLTSRVAVADIQRFKDGSAPVVDLEKLSEEAGAELLRDNDLWGIEADLRSASRNFAGHPLALTLLASYLKETQNGDVRRRDHLRGLLADADNPRQDQARRVMDSYEKEWLADQPILLAILHIVGLFDRPASGDCLRALRAEPAIPGLTEALIDLDDDEWRDAVARLREVRLLAPADPSDPDALDAHPLVREWFGERLKATNEAAWEAAHSRLYDHLRETTHEGQTPTLADLTPLYHAIANGCRAGRHQEALVEVYQNRICRWLPDGSLEFYANRKLGSFGSDLAATSWFFDRPYHTPSATLTLRDQAWVLGYASAGLRAQGRLEEALSAMREALQIEEASSSWRNAAIVASNLSETELLVGEIAAATATAEKAVSLADLSAEPFQMLTKRVTHGNALHAAGELEKAERLFADAEGRQEKFEPKEPLLYALQGYCYCDLLLSWRQIAVARDRAIRSIKIAQRNKWVLATALDALTLGRAHLALGLASGSSAESANAEALAGRSAVEEAIEGLRASASNHHVPRGLVARASFRRAVGDWAAAARDLDEVQEIAESGPMRLYLCDIALERARLALASREAFAPLNGLVEPSPPPPAPPDATAAAGLRHEARQQLDAARKLIADCGYHRRDEELIELDDVVADRRRFADLPPRV
jgi:tetratricopeptide (TPR) repeat protein